MAEKKHERIVIDTSAIIEGIVSKKIQAGELKPNEILIHEAVLSELEHQANKNRETGYLGIEEIKLLRELSKKYKYTITYRGTRPQDFEIKFAKSGEIDSLIRLLAFEEKATLITGDRVQSLIAESKGISVMFIEFEKKPRKLTVDKFFDKLTMSVHIREGIKVTAKKGSPGNWKFEEVSKEEITREQVKEMAKEIVEETQMREDGFIEIQRKGSTIVQLGNLRIVIIKPPLSDGWEITIVRPVKILTLDDYRLSEKLKTRITLQAEGILIAGAPGQGKSTFTQALAEFYASREKIVKTIEAPRDLQLSNKITQYAISHSTKDEIHDVLLLSRPDYTIFDEMRNTDDFNLYADLRLAGVGMVGVIHATKPVDSIQRFLSRLELGVIPQIIDTVLFIKDGTIQKVLSVYIDVKVPAGMTESDLARPVVVIGDFETGKPEFEAYSYGDQTMIVPIKEKDMKSPLAKLATKTIKEEFLDIVDDVEVDIVSDNKCIVYVPEGQIGDVIGKGGSRIQELEQKIGMSIDISPLDKSKKESTNPKNQVGYDLEMRKEYIMFHLDSRYIGKNIKIMIEDSLLLSAQVSLKSMIKLKRDSNMGKIISKAFQNNERVTLVI